MKYAKLTAAALLIGAFALTSIGAASESEQITALLNRELTVKYNGNSVIMFDRSGESVYPITYEGTTYLPIRTLCDLLDLDIHWNSRDYAVEIEAHDFPLLGSVTREEFELSVNSDGAIVLTAYNGKGGDVKIPDGVAVIGKGAFDQVLLSSRGVGVPTSVYIPDSVRVIEDMAFFASVDSSGEGLKSVRMSSSIESIGRNAFASCTLLESVSFDALPSHEIAVDESAFADCPSLERNPLDKPLPTDVEAPQPTSQSSSESK